MNAMTLDGEECQQHTEDLQECTLKAAEETGVEIVVHVLLKCLAFTLI